MEAQPVDSGFSSPFGITIAKNVQVARAIGGLSAYQDFVGNFLSLWERAGVRVSLSNKKRKLSSVLFPVHLR